GNGYISVAMEDVAQSYNQQAAQSGSPPCSVDEVEEALLFVQKLDPPGIGARSAEECLLLQLNADTPHRELVRLLIVNHLEDVAHNRLPVIQRRTGFDLATIKEAIEVLKHLNLKPGARFLSDNIPYVVPDIVVERKEDGEYDIRLVDDWVPNI